MKRHFPWVISIALHLAALFYFILEMDHKGHVHSDQSVSINFHASHKAHIKDDNVKSSKLSQVKKFVEDILGEQQHALEEGLLSDELVEASTSYFAYLNAAIDAEKSYPIRARRLGDEGRVVVKIKINKEGRLNEVKIIESSKSKILDNAALNLIQRTSPFKKLPEGSDELEVDVPIEWYL